MSIAEIEKLLDKTEAKFAKAFREYIKGLKSAAQLKIVMQYLENNDIEGLVKHFNNSKKPFASIIAAAMLETGYMETASLQPKIKRYLDRKTPPGLRSPVVGIEFQISNERAAQILREQTATLITQINETQRQVIYATLADAQIEGKHPRDIGRAIVNNIGLTTRQEAAVKNYERLLRAGSKEALTRDLRDRRSDSKIRRGAALDESQIQRMVISYRNRYEKYRGDMIARTESHKAVNQAQQEALRQSIEQAGINPNDVKQQWRSTRDKRTRDSHDAINGQKQKLGQPFVTPSGAKLMHPSDTSLGAPASEVIQCRCTTNTIFKD